MSVLILVVCIWGFLVIVKVMVVLVFLRRCLHGWCLYFFLVGFVMHCRVFLLLHILFCFIRSFVFPSSLLLEDEGFIVVSVSVSMFIILFCVYFCCK